MGEVYAHPSSLCPECISRMFLSRKQSHQVDCIVPVKGCNLLTTLLDSYLPRVITCSSVLSDTFLLALASLVPGAS